MAQESLPSEDRCEGARKLGSGGNSSLGPSLQASLCPGLGVLRLRTVRTVPGPQLTSRRSGFGGKSIQWGVSSLRSSMTPHFHGPFLAVDSLVD